jgi:hypothetical protein
MKCASSTTIESLDLQHQLVQNFAPNPTALVPSNSIPYLPQANELDLTTTNIFEIPDVRGDAESHACQLHNEILGQCLDNTGIYSCKKYSPRCYIIQKVIHNIIRKLTRFLQH